MRPVRQVQSPLLVGRDELLVLADTLLAGAAAGLGHALLLAGEAGIGKTRLEHAIQRKAEAAGFRLGRGDLSPHDSQVSLAAVFDLGRTIRRDARWGTLGAQLLAVRGGKGADSLASRQLLVHEVADLFIDHVDRPTMLVFDDLQWADELTLEVIWELAHRAADLPLLLVAGYRVDELPLASVHREWRARLLSQRLAHEARLRPLTLDETAVVVSSLLATGLPAPREVVAAVHQRSDGIPLHVEELLAALDDDARTSGRAILDAHVPDTIEDAVLARYARLSPDARAAARAGAVVGRCFIPDVVAGLLDRPVAELDAPLAELVEQGFLFPFQFVDQGYYDFRHQLLRDALYDAAAPAELHRLHARAAEFGSMLVGGGEVHASVHYERAGLRLQAYRAARASARAAAAVTSRRESFELYQRAAANLPDDLPAAERAALYDELCGASFAVDDVEVAIASARQARHWHLEAEEPVLAALALLSQAAIARRDVWPTEERRRLLDQALAELDAQPPDRDRDLALAEARSFEAVVARDKAQLDAARALYLAVKDLAAGDTEFEQQADYDLAELDVLGGATTDGLARMLRVAREARAMHYEANGVTAFRWAAAAAVRVMDYPVAAIGVEEGLRYSHEVEQSYCRHVLAATSAHLAWAAGDWDEAIRIAEIELVEKGSRRGTLGSRDALGYVALGRGEVDRARTLLGDSLRIGMASGEVDLVLPPLWGLAEAALVAGDPVEAIDRCEAAFEVVAGTDERALLVPFVVTGVRASIAARRPEAAEAWLARTRAHLDGWERASAALAHADGLIRLAAGSTVAARTLLESAVAGWDALGRTWERAWARLDLAACLVRGNRHLEALPVLADVRAIADRLVSPPIAARVDELLGTARSRGITDEPWRPLTAREFEVSRLIADGLTNAEIAHALGLSPKTVSAHVEHILAKLGATRRTEIAAWVVTVRAPEAVAVTR